MAQAAIPVLEVARPLPITLIPRQEAKMSSFGLCDLCDVGRMIDCGKHYECERCGCRTKKFGVGFWLALLIASAALIGALFQLIA